MLGTEFNFSRLQTIRVLVAGIAILAGSLAQAAPVESTALPAPWAGGIGSQEGSTALLPQPLAPQEAVRLRRILALQAAGDFAAARAEMDWAPKDSLFGDILADNYLHGGPASAAELADWLSRYASHPDAPAIQGLLLRALPPDAPRLQPIAAPAMLLPEPPLAAPPEEIEPSYRLMPRNPMLDRTVHDWGHDGAFAKAEKLIAHTKGLTPAYAAQLRAELARILFTQERDEDALALAQLAAHGAPQIGLADYVAGLAAWRLGRITLAGSLFEAAWHASLAPAAMRAGAAFWAARVHLRDHDAAGYVPWMRHAAEYPRTFYGLLARRALGLDTGLAWTQEEASPADLESVAETREGARAFAWLQLGEKSRAETELRLLWPKLRVDSMRRSVMLVAQAAGLSDLAGQLAAAIQVEDGQAPDNARFPLPALDPAGGFILSPALVYAVTRVESNFNANAISPAGAHGLMQITPNTADYLEGAAPPAAELARLHNPAENLAMGQRYLRHLGQLNEAHGDLIRVLASYNAGPASFARWSATMRTEGDPLLFIESIPLDETRGFVPRILAYSWIYAARMHLPSRTLDELAAGAWPSFNPPPQATLASNTP